jgi:ComEC/Rec2-related protein
MTGIFLGTAFLLGALFGIVVAPLALMISALLWFLRQASGVVAVLIVVLTVAGAARVTPDRIQVDDALVVQISAVRGTVGSLPNWRNGRISVDVSVKEVLIDDAWRPAKGSMRASVGGGSRVGYGDRVYLVGSATPLSELPAGVRSAFVGRGIWATIYVTSAVVDERGHGFRRWLADERERISIQIQQTATGDAGALLSGFVTGDDSRLSETANERFVATGTSHVTAISGANFGVILAVMIVFGHWSGIRRKWSWQIATCGIVWFYAALTGLTPSACRAAFVATGVVLAYRAGRRPDFVTLVLLSAAIEIAIWPEHVSTLSFRLSVASSLALTLVGQGLQLVGLRGWFGAAFITAAAAQIATLPLLAPTFETYSFVSVPTNILIAAPVTLAFELALLGSFLFLVYEPLGALCIKTAEIPATVVLGVIDFFGSQSWASIDLYGMSHWWQVVFVVVSVGLIALVSPEVHAWARRSYGNPVFVDLSRWAAAGAVVGLVIGWGLVLMGG